MDGESVSLSSTDEVIDYLMEQDDVNWNSVIRTLVRDEGMDPWDVDVETVASKFLGIIEEMKDLDFRLSGKMVLATAFFVKVKSDKLMEEDIEALDTMMMEPDELYDELEEPEEPAPFQDVEPELVPHTPQPRKRKVSVQDLASALESALEQEQRNYMKRVKQRKQTEAEAPEVDAPEEQQSIEEIIDDVYTTIKSYFKKVKEVTFDSLVTEETKEEKVQTFIPLLHLDNQGKVILHQDEAFDDIKVVEDDRQS